jgi:maleate isomerase
MLTPSSNTVLEPVTQHLLTTLPDVTMHISRFRVTKIALDKAALGQFDDAPILAAAGLLADAKVDVITWNGTSASWLGLDRDRHLVARIEAETGIPASTCMLGFFDLFRARNVKRLGLVTPYTPDVQQRIIETYRREGVEVVIERHLSLRDNFSFGTVPADTIATMIGEAAAARPDAVAVVCTNMNGAEAAARIEADTGVPVFDSVAVTLRACLRRIGHDTTALKPWGSVFA